MAFNIDAVRGRFPALQQDQVFLDNAGGSQTLGTVVDSITTYLTGTNVQLGASYAVGKGATARYMAAYEAGARFINAQPDEIAFGPSTTQLFRNLSYALKFQAGDEIVLSAIDHEANITPWLDMVERLGLVLKWWRPTGGTDPELRASDLKKLLSKRTRLVICTHVSNVLGTITDVKAMADTAHSVGALMCVDGVAYAAHRPIDVKAFGVDFYAFSWYKVYGPHVATLYGKWTAQLHVRSLGHSFNPSLSLSDKLSLSGASYELIQAVPHVVDYLGPPGSKDNAWAGIIAHEKKLQSTFINALNAHPDITVYGKASDDVNLRVSTVSFSVCGWNSKSFVEAVEAVSTYAFRWGTYYSSRLVRETLGLGADGAVRVSIVHYNTLDEIRGLIKAIENVINPNSIGNGAASLTKSKKKSKKNQKQRNDEAANVAREVDDVTISNAGRVEGAGNLAKPVANGMSSNQSKDEMFALNKTTSIMDNIVRSNWADDEDVELVHALDNGVAPNPGKDEVSGLKKPKKTKNKAKKSSKFVVYEVIDQANGSENGVSSNSSQVEMPLMSEVPNAMRTAPNPPPYSELNGREQPPRHRSRGGHFKWKQEGHANGAYV